MTRQRVSLANGTSKGLVLDLIRAQGPISRVSLAEATGLTQATMSTLVRQLIGDGLVVETGHGESTGGKRPVMLDVDPDSRCAIGVQLGEESTTYVVINLAGAIVGRTRTASVGAVEPTTMVELIADEIARMLATFAIEKHRVVGVGVVAPGPLDLSRGMILGPPHMLSWHDVPIRTMLSERINVPVVLDNDASAAALGDFWSGRLDGSVAHATVYMGAGIGAGVLVDGTVFRGASSNAAELGQVVVAAEGDRLLTLEEVADPDAIVRRARTTPRLSKRLGLGGVDTFEDFRAIATAAVHGDAEALALIEASANHMATAVLTMANLFDVDSISLAGPGFAVAGSMYVRALSSRLEREFFARARHRVRVRLSADVIDAAAVGGAALVLQTELAPRAMGLASLTG